MKESIMWICAIAGIICPLVALASIIFSNYNIGRHMHSIESTFQQLYRDSESRIDRTNEMICKLSACIEKTENVLMTITNDYEHRMDKLQETHDKVMEQNGNLTKQNGDLTKQNAILSAAATVPHINVTNATQN